MRQRLLLRLSAATAVVTLGGVLLLPVAQADAATVTYSAVTTVAPPPPTQFQGAGGGDGWGLAFTPTEVFNVFHHQPTLQVECHLDVDASQCTSNAWPVTITDSAVDAFAGDNFATSAQPAVWIDETTGDLYVYATAYGSNGTGTAGVVCVDTSSSDPDPFCGFTPLSAIGDAPTEQGISATSAGVIVGTNFYSFNYVSEFADFAPAGLGTTNTMMCFSLTTFSACASQPYAVDYGGGNDQDNSFPVPGVSTVGTDVVVPISTDSGGPLLTCFDTTTESTCTGSWPIADPEGFPTPDGAAIPDLDGSGNPIGFCLRSDTECFDLTGASIATPTGLPSVVQIADGSGWIGNPAVLGDRVIFAWVGGADCFDFSTDAECANYPITLPNYDFGYTMNLDPNRPGCIWGNADGGSGQIQNFDAYTGGPCGSGGDRVLLSGLIAGGDTCLPTSYQDLTILSPDPSTYSGGTVQFEDIDGNALGSPVAIDGTGAADISGLDLSAQTTLPQAVINLPGAPSVPVQVEVTWQGSDALECDLSPEPPLNPGAAVVSGGVGVGNYTLTWDPPTFDGGSPITGYTVTALPGGATCATTSLLTCEIDGMPNTSNYTFHITATNAVGNSSPASTTPTGLLPGPAVSSSPPIVSGNLTVGDTMSSTTGSWAVDQGIFTYQWYSCTDEPITTPAVDSDCTAVGTNQDTYVTQPSDGGDYIAAVVSDEGTDDTTTSASSNVVGQVTGPALNSLAPVISGTTDIGQSVNSTTGNWADSNGTYAYQWFSCTDAPSGSPSSDVHCTEVGTNASTYPLVTGDLGHHIADVVTATGTDASTATAHSNVLGPVTGAAVLVHRPLISGHPVVGQTLHSTRGMWSDAVAFSYQWFSCTDLPSLTPGTDANCKSVGSDEPTYVLKGTDLHHHITEVVTATGSDSSQTSQRSNMLGPVAAVSVVRAFHLKAAVFFAENSTALTPADMVILNHVAAVVAAHGAKTISLVGCTDKNGSRAYNLALSKARTLVVRSYLLKALASRNDTSVGIRTVGIGIIVQYANLALDRRVNISV